MQQLSLSYILDGKTIGFVPTMGFLHDGHSSLIKESKAKSDLTVVSIFVNPTQFSPHEDLNKYPRDIERDKQILKENNIDILFLPSEKDIYPENFQTYIEVNKITKILEGKFRPAHFKGVTTIVTILLNSVKPDFAFFGQKDAQQAAVIKQMVHDLKLDVEIIVCPVIRENDGLAMSSRNIYLNPLERKDAVVLSDSLKLAEKLIKNGERKKNHIVKELEDRINKISSSKIDYVEIVDAKNFSPVEELGNGNDYFILIACKIGETRLIDNIKIFI